MNIDKIKQIITDVRGADHRCSIVSFQECPWRKEIADRLEQALQEG